MGNNNFLASNTLLTQTTGYYQTIEKLTPKAEATGETTNVNTQQESNASAVAFAVYSPLFIFIILFVSAYALLFAGRLKNIKKLSSILILASFAASIPYILRHINTGVDFYSQANLTEIPYKVNLIQASPTQMNIIWQTDKSGIGAVRYCQIPCELDSAPVIIADNARNESGHQIILSDLDSKKTYQLEILSGKIWYDNNGVPLLFQLE